jgi:hypothetical protein
LQAGTRPPDIGQINLEMRAKLADRRAEGSTAHRAHLSADKLIEHHNDGVGLRTAMSGKFAAAARF